MNENKMELLNIASEFGEMAYKVNESSTKRKGHAENTLNIVNDIFRMYNKLLAEFEVVAKANGNQRGYDSKVLQNCETLKFNVEKQLSIINGLVEENNSPLFESVENIINRFDDSLVEVISGYRQIWDNNVKLQLYDKQLEIKKELQLKSLKQLSDLADISVSDASESVKGSLENINRSKHMFESYEKIDDLIEKKDYEALNFLLVDATQGWSTAVNVNKKSNVQYEFAKEVYSFVGYLHDTASSIKELVQKKHNVYEQTLQIVTVVAVNISMKFKKYLEIEEKVRDLKLLLEDRLEKDLLDYITITIREIKEMLSKNYDMTENSHINNENEAQTLELTKKELELFGKMKHEIKLMTEATEFPVYGSNKNITNGQKIEKLIKTIIDTID